MAKKTSAARLHKQRIERVERAGLELISYVEHFYNNHSETYGRRKNLLEKAREYGAAINRLGGRR